MNYRAPFHDYHKPGAYMFTVQKHPEAPPFSSISGDPRREGGVGAPIVELSPVGKIFDDEIQRTNKMRYEQLVIDKYIIMPDHAHILIFIKEETVQPVTKIIAAIESATTRRCRDLGLIGEKAAVFRGCGMNDRIVFDDSQLQILKKYIDDNPRRLLIKRLYPDLFRRNLGVKINDDTIDCIGNIFLLRKPMMAVHVRRRWNIQEVQEYKARCIRAAAAGIVLISPFIHPVENEIRKMVLEGGGSLIQVLDHGFGERFKPTGRSMDTCAEGRLLLISEAGATLRREDMSYSKASRLNDLAERIAAISPASALNLSRGGATRIKATGGGKDKRRGGSIG